MKHLIYNKQSEDNKRVQTGHPLNFILHRNCTSLQYEENYNHTLKCLILLFLSHVRTEHLTA